MHIDLALMLQVLKKGTMENWNSRKSNLRLLVTILLNDGQLESGASNDRLSLAYLSGHLFINTFTYDFLIATHLLKTGCVKIG